MNSLGKTDLNEEELELLIPTHITTRGQLDEWEQLNILEAEQFAFNRNFRIEDILLDKFIKQLHYKMFANTWKWAGTFRKTEKYIGIKWYEIPVELKKLLDYTLYWFNHSTYNGDELAIRFHHRLAQIHPFPNGNGRHARLIADILIVNLNGKRFSWGKTNLTKHDEMRKNYINSLERADYHNDYKPLLKFARS
jgi:Fic-DOC domain mobile mystery protein B